MKKGKKTGLLVLVIVLFVLLGGALAGGAVYIHMRQQDGVFFNRTKLNGKQVQGLTVDEVFALLQEDFNACKVTVTEKGEEALSGNLKDFGYSLDEDKIRKSLDKALLTQRNSFFTTIESLLNGSAFRVPLSYVQDEAVFMEKVKPDTLKEPRTASQNAYLTYDGQANVYSVVPEVYGNEMDAGQLQSLVEGQLQTFMETEPSREVLSVSIPEDLYIRPSVTAQDPELNTECNVNNTYCKSSVTYLFGSQSKVLDWNTVKDWIVFEDGSGRLSEDRLLEYVRSLEAEYNTQYIGRTFYTTIGTEVYIPGADNEYGYTINEDAELETLKANLASGESISREPVYFESNAYENPYHYNRDGADDLAGTYVEVNLSLQHLWFYVDWNLVVESDFVSGCVARNAETKTGVYPLAYKESPSVLVGDNAEDGYRQEVQFWMPFYEGQGLHDASWRGAFGGNIYVSSGSHGCVNLPYWAAEAIYNSISPGMAIVIYK